MATRMTPAELEAHRAGYRKECVTPDIDACYEMMREKFHWDFDGLISPVDITTRCKVGNILCALFIPQEPGAECKNPWSYTKEEYHLIEMAATEIGAICGR